MSKNHTEYIKEFFMWYVPTYYWEWR